LDPYPDRILAGRVRALPDLNVALLEVVKPSRVDINEEGDHRTEFFTEYRLIEVIRGRADGPWNRIRYHKTIASPLAPGQRIANPATLLPLKTGSRFLYFSGAEYDSCRMVPATPSAESAVRMAVPPAKREEDDISGFWGRM